MTAIFSFVQRNRVVLLTDTGVFSESGELVAIRTKVFCGSKRPFAMIARGDVHRVLALQEDLFRDEPWSVDDWLSLTRECIASRRAHRRREDLEMLIACYSETLGPCHFFACFHDMHHKLPPFELRRMPREFGAGPSFDINELPSAAQESIGEDDFPDRFGADVLEAMRKPVPGGPPHVLVGGSAQLSIIRPFGIEHRVLRTWNDRLGERVKLP